LTVGTSITGTYGSINIASNGSYTYTLNNSDPDTIALTQGQVVSEVFTYTIKDSDGDLSHTTVTLSITGKDSTPPIAINDSVMVDRGQSIIINILSNDFDLETGLDPSTVRIVGSPDGKTLIVAGQGTWTVNSSGQITFTPQAGFTGDPTPIQYTVKDRTGLESNQAIVSIDYPQTPPIAVNDRQTGVIGQSVTVNVVSNDLDLENDLDPSTVKIVGTMNAGESLVVSGQGTWSVNPSTGAITFTPLAGFTGDPTPIRYTVRDKTGLESNAAILALDYPEVSLDFITSGSIIMLSNDGRGLLADYNELEKKEWRYDFKYEGDYALPLPHLSLYVPLGRHVISLTGDLRDQLVLELEPYSFSVPKWSFRHTEPNEQLEFEATRPDGSPLPDWLKFDSKSLKFSGTPPRGAREEYVMVTARDSYGNEVHATFTVRVEKECGKNSSNGHGKPCETNSPSKSLKPKIKVHEKPPVVAKSGLSEQVNAVGKLSKLQQSRALLDSLKQL
ncbi:partial Calcium-binding lectin RapA2, partial [uncultured bacterium]